MPIIGNPIYQSAFVVDQFSGNGSTTAFTMSVAPAGVTNVLVAVSGVLQDPSTYGVVGNTITFSAAPPSGTGNISCRYLGVPASGVTTTAYRTVTEFTATASQTTFTPPSYNVGFINVYLNGVLLGSADYTATNGTTVVLATGASAGNLLTVESFSISSVANAIPNAAGSVSSSNIVDGAVTPAKLSTGGPSWDASGNLTVTGATANLYVNSSTAANNSNVWIRSGGADTLGFEAQAPTSAGGGGGGFISLRNPAGTLNFRTTTGGSSLNTVMSIDGSGRVTMPYQPVFHINKNNGAQTGVAVITFDYVTTNVGSYYSTSTNRFTAPTAGTYHFYASVLDDGAAAAHQGPRFGLRKNGTVLQLNQNFYGRSDSFYNFAHVELTVALASGDYVDVYNESGGPIYGSDSKFGYFGGWLIG